MDWLNAVFEQYFWFWLYAFTLCSYIIPSIHTTRPVERGKGGNFIMGPLSLCIFGNVVLFYWYTKHLLNIASYPINLRWWGPPWTSPLLGFAISGPTYYVSFYCADCCAIEATFGTLTLLKYDHFCILIVSYTR